MQNRQRQFQRFIYRVRHEYVTMNNIVLVVAAMIAVSWAWASVEAVQRNYQLAREVETKKLQQRLIALQTENLQYEQRYYQSEEYLALEARRRLGLVEPGEKVLVLPPNSAAVMAESAQEETAVASMNESPPPIEQWMDFLFGARQD